MKLPPKPQTKYRVVFAGRVILLSARQLKKIADPDSAAVEGKAADG
ncbi:MAG: hypothetical protein AB1403_14060 [Candidatus Riflebacteria bacterium]